MPPKRSRPWGSAPPPRQGNDSPAPPLCKRITCVCGEKTVGLRLKTLGALPPIPPQGQDRGALPHYPARGLSPLDPVMQEHPLLRKKLDRESLLLYGVHFCFFCKRMQCVCHNGFQGRNSLGRVVGRRPTVLEQSPRGLRFSPLSANALHVFSDRGRKEC